METLAFEYTPYYAPSPIWGVKTATHTNPDTILSAHDWAINTDMTVTEYATNIQAFRNETLQDWEATTPDELRHMADHIRHDYADTLDAIANQWEQHNQGDTTP